MLAVVYDPHQVWAQDQIIGHVTSVDKRFWDLKIQGAGAEREVKVNAPIYEHDVIQTMARQHLSIVLEDGSELLIGPSTRVILKNWNERNSERRLLRVVHLQIGTLKVKVRKIYSQEEPFIVENKRGVVAVRGTEFVVETGTGSRKLYSELEQGLRSSEVELHTLEGEVQFARNIVALSDPEKRVSVIAGQTSVLRLNMVRPQQPHAFDLAKFNTYLARSIPGVKLAVVPNTTNEHRAELASNSKLDSKTASPAKPAFAQTKPPAITRGIASFAGATRLIEEKKDSHERRKALGFERDRTLKQRLANAQKRSRTTTDGAHDAFQGAESLSAQENNASLGNDRSLAAQRQIRENVFATDPGQIRRIPGADDSLLHPNTGAEPRMSNGVYAPHGTTPTR